MAEELPTRRRWRMYRTEHGRNPVGDFVHALPDADAAAVLGKMIKVGREGMRAARHLEGDIYEVRAKSQGSAYRVLFAREGARGQVLLALEGINKKSQKTPQPALDVAKQRLSDWRLRGVALRSARERPRAVGR
jgi:phage-related protein